MATTTRVDRRTLTTALTEAEALTLDLLIEMGKTTLVDETLTKLLESQKAPTRLWERDQLLAKFQAATPAKRQECLVELRRILG